MSWGELTCEHYGNCRHNPTMKTCNLGCKYYLRKHDTNSEYCWCNPKIKELENGNKIIIHNETDACIHNHTACGYFDPERLICEIDNKLCANIHR